MTQSLAGRITGIKGSDLETSADIARTQLVTETGKEGIPLTSLRVWDAMHTNLPGTEAANDDLFLNTGTWPTDVPSVQTRDSGALTTTQKAGFLYTMRPEYVDNGTVTVRFDVGMLTTVSDTTATIDLVAYLCDYGLTPGSDLVSTAAIDINGDTAADSADFTLTPSTLVSGSQIMMVVTIAIVDGATAPVVAGKIGAIEVLYQMKG